MSQKSSQQTIDESICSAHLTFVASYVSIVWPVRFQDGVGGIEFMMENSWRQIANKKDTN